MKWSGFAPSVHYKKPLKHLACLETCRKQRKIQLSHLYDTCLILYCLCDHLHIFTMFTSYLQMYKAYSENVYFGNEIQWAVIMLYRTFSFGTTWATWSSRIMTTGICYDGSEVGLSDHTCRLYLVCSFGQYRCRRGLIAWLLLVETTLSTWTLYQLNCLFYFH